MTSKSITIFRKGLITGLTLQLAIGPVFFFIINLTLQKTFWNGLIAICAVTLVDYFYITLSILGLGKILEKPMVKKPLGTISYLVLILFGFLILKSIIINFNGLKLTTAPNNLISSFTSAFILTISSPMTIVFFTSIFTAKAVENNFSKKELSIFGFGTGLATFIFMGLMIILFSIIKTTIPLLLIQLLNGLVGVLLIFYGLMRLIKIFKNKNSN